MQYVLALTSTTFRAFARNANNDGNFQYTQELNPRITTHICLYQSAVFVIGKLREIGFENLGN